LDAPKWFPWSGLAAILGGAIAIALTPAFASAYFIAYPGFDTVPFWVEPLEPHLGPLLTFASPDGVYETYGKVYDLVYLLFLPAVLALHRVHGESPSPTESRGYALLTTGLLAAFVGVAGDYWADGITFLISVLGLLIMAVGVTTYGVALHRSRVVPRWCAWMFILCGPGTLIFMVLIGHIPSGPTFPFAVTWLVLGFMLLLKKGIGPPRPSGRRVTD
jgi:hypothetical protein